jgi:hypothetical protein
MRLSDTFEIRRSDTISWIRAGTGFRYSSTRNRQRDYRSALEIALKVNMPGFWRTQVAFAAAHGQLGEEDAARRAVRELLKINSDFAVVARDELRKWYDPDLTEHLLEGLAKAGLDLP